MRPMHRFRPSHVFLASLATSLPAAAQIGFSITYEGPTIGMPDSLTGAPITEGDVLTPATPGGTPLHGPLPTPGILVPGGPGGLGSPLHLACAGHGPGVPCLVEVDALSLGFDHDLVSGPTTLFGGLIWFSVDPYAVGLPGPVAPSVFGEAPFGEASGDVFTDLGLGIGPLPPFAVPPANVGALDANGLVSPSGYSYPGLGIVEPNPPGPPPTAGDDLDAFEIPEFAPGFGGAKYFSLDAAFVDPLTGIPNTGSAAAHGFSGADVLVTGPSGGPPLVYAPAGMLGLDLLGFGTDDLDALILRENGVPGFQPSITPYDWLKGTDMLLFSVRRGSAVVGMPDSIFGLPIQEGDVLTTPLPAFLGGLSPFPGILFAAENLGLATTRSSPVAFGDDVDALDAICFPLFDCDGDGIEDAVAIAKGIVLDLDENGIPDVCEGGPFTYCYGDGSGTPCPCGNSGVPGHGCANGTFAGGAKLSPIAGGGLVVTSATPSTSVLLFRGTIQANGGNGLVFGDGLRCVGGSIVRLGAKALDAFGSATYPSLPPVVGTHYYQAWYRDPTLSPCGSGFNLSNALEVP